MISEQQSARLAGLLYLILLPTVGLWYGFTSSLIAENAAGTLANIQANRALFQSSIVVGALGFVDFLLLGLVLQQVLRPVGQRASHLLLAFVAVSVPISLVAVARQIDILSLLDGALGLPAMDQAQLQMHLLLALQSYTSLFQLSSLFWGLWLIPLGWLIYGSGILPRPLGILLMLGSVFYILAFAGPLFDPGYATSTLAGVVGIVSGIPGVLGELGTIFCLLLKGTSWRAQRLE